MEFIKTFENNSDYVSYRDGGKYEMPNVSLSRDTKKVHYNLYANNHEYVDLGLPSGTLWATMNVGASSSGETGFYFQWGDTSGYTADQVGTGMEVVGKDSVTPAKVSKSMASTSSITTGGAGTGGITIPGGAGTGGITIPGSGESYNKKPFNWSDYKWYLSGSGNTISFKKYTVTGATLDLEDDAAYVNWGGDWHIPTPDQIQELIDNTIAVWTASNGVSGMTFTSSNGKSIFIPAAGWARGGSVNSSGKGATLWSSMLSMNEIIFGQYLNFSSSGIPSLRNDVDRYIGLSIRCVIG